MRCLVTGVAGFIGSHLAERLLADGHEVCGIDNFLNYYPRSIKEGNLRALRSQPGFTFVEGNLLVIDLQPYLAKVDGSARQLGQRFRALHGLQCTGDAAPAGTRAVREGA